MVPLSCSRVLSRSLGTAELLVRVDKTEAEFVSDRRSGGLLVRLGCRINVEMEGMRMSEVSKVGSSR